ncbi:MAG: leucine-rich repeat protein [Bacilli bacterium]|nr:leucine-rich repeat protein [Bacilli bacterium]
MRKRKILFIIVSFMILSSLIGGVFFLKNKLSKKDLLDELININQLDEEFMNRYYAEMEELLESDHSENILILVAKKKPKDVYGAKKVVEAPNHTFFLEYENEKDTYDAKKKFEKDESIYSVEENREYTISGDSSTISSNNYNSWGIERMGLDHAIDYIGQNGGENVTVAIIDTGCDMDLFNSYYSGKINSVYNLFEVDTYGNNVMFDHVGHGTHIAGTIAEGTPSNVKILPIKVADTGKFNSDAVIYALNYITDGHKADVINMSFGGDMPSNPQTTSEYIAIEAARRDNIISLAASGNEGDEGNEMEAPAGYDNTISIGSVDANLNRSYFSTYNEAVTFAAPGSAIKSINGTMDGTSMATPHAVCAVAFLKSIQKNLSFEMVIDALKQNVIDLGAKGKDVYYGYGFIDLSSFSLCEGDDITNCTNLASEESFSPTSIVVTDVSLTPYNYGSITNLMSSTIKLIDNNNQFEEKRFDQVDDLVISDYDPYAEGSQTVTVHYLDLETTFVVTNPTDFPMGWKYDYARDDNNEVTEDYAITGYYDHNMELEKLYFPNTINNHKVVSIKYMDIEMPYVFDNSVDVSHYKEVYLPSNIKTVGQRVFKRFANLYKVKSNASELKVESEAFSELPYLTTVEANVLFDSVSGGAFKLDQSLTGITLSSNNKVIPYEAFYGCTSFESISLQGVTEIKEYSFTYTAISELTIPRSVVKVGQGAFAETDISRVAISSALTSIGPHAFSGRNFREVTVSNNNPVYDSRDGCNAIIETSTNTLVVGSNATVVPSTVKHIGNYAFYGSYIGSIDLPQGLESIGDYSFANCILLNKVVMANSINSIEDTSFVDTGYYAQFGTKFYVYDSSYSYQYVLQKKYAYVLLNETTDAPDFEQVLFTGKRNYLPYQTLDLSSYTLSLKPIGIDEWETITEFKDPTYPEGRDSFRNGDEYAYLYFDTKYGHHNLLVSIPVIIGKLTPEYVIPTEIHATINSTLADVDLPAGFEWEDGSIVLSELGDFVYDARYIPEDIDNYNIVEDIAIPVHVIDKTLIKPTVTVEDKEYDGTDVISVDSVTISGIDENDYSLVSATLEDVNVGTRKAFVKLRLTDDKFETHAFSNGGQEKIFTVELQVFPKTLSVPTMVEHEYVYNGEMQTAIIDGFDEETMDIYGNQQTDAGTYTIIVRLKSDNYRWETVPSREVGLTFVIEKADFECSISDQEVLYDGLEHSLSIEVPDNISVYYLDMEGLYTLTKAPTYILPGVYTYHYLLRIDDNYNSIVGENTLTIIATGIVNSTKDYETIYDGEYHSISLDVSVDEYTVRYSIDNTNYDLEELPRFKDVGEYTVNYIVDCDEFDPITGSNKVRIYGIKEFDSAIDVKSNNILVVTNNKFNTLTSKITTYSSSTEFLHYTSSNTLTSSNIIKTGDTIVIKINNDKTFSYKLAYLGDVDGTGIIDIIDYIRIMRHLMRDITLTGVNKEAADVDKSGVIDIIDYIRIMKRIMGGN